MVVKKAAVWVDAGCCCSYVFPINLCSGFLLSQICSSQDWIFFPARLGKEFFANGRYHVSSLI
jgi:hypothetical protein